MTHITAAQEPHEPAESSGTGTSPADAGPEGGIILGAQHPVLVLDQGTVQVGVGPRALRLTGERGTIDETLSRLREGVPAASVGPVAAQLVEQGLAEPLDAQHEARARRRLSTVVVEGLGLCGTQIAHHLATLGIGTMLLRDGRRVRAEDVGPVFRTVHLGRDRVSAVQETLSHRAAEVAVMECPPGSSVMGADVHVLCTGPAGAQLFSQAASQTPVVLPVMMEPAGWRIGPLISTGGLSCPECLELGRREADPHDGALQRALRTGAEEVLEPTPCGSSAEAMRILAHTAAGIAAQQVQTLIQGRQRPATADHVVTLDASAGLVSQRPTGPHPECACATLTAGSVGRAAPRRQRGRPRTMRRRPETDSASAGQAQALPGAPPGSPAPGAPEPGSLSPSSSPS